MRLEERVAKRGLSPVMERVIVEASIMADKVNEARHSKLDAICHCGDCEDAYRAALRQYIQLRDSGHCPYWMVQIAAAMRYFAVMDMMHHFDTKPEELAMDVSKSNPRGAMDESRSDELQMMLTLQMQEATDVETIMSLFGAQPKGSRGYKMSGELITELFATLDRIKAAQE